MNKYQKFVIPKRRPGEYRTIYAPNVELNGRLKEMLAKWYRYTPSPFAHGFVPGRNIVTNAGPHVGKKIVISIDIKDFFPSIELNAFVDVMTKLEIDVDSDKLRLCFVPIGNEWVLPQGFPTSPHLSNLFLKDFDWRLARYIRRQYSDADYTRYADDLTISANDDNICTVIKVIECYLKHYGLSINRRKLKIMRRHRRQNVCGIVVNDKIHLPREYRKRLRAMKHQENKSKEAKGHYAFEYMVGSTNPEYQDTASIIESWEVIKKLSMI